MAGDKPSFKVLLVSKVDKTKRVGLLAAWPSMQGESYTGKFDQQIVALKLADGSVVKPDAVYINLYDNRESGPSSSPQRAATKPAPSSAEPPDFGGDDDLPF